MQPIVRTAKARMRGFGSSQSYIVYINETLSVVLVHTVELPASGHLSDERECFLSRSITFGRFEDIFKEMG